MEYAPDGKSRSQKKRESAALQSLGEELARLPHEQLPALALPPELEEALRLLPTINAHEARRRQKQLIGRLMRLLEEDEIMNVQRCLKLFKKTHKI
ncbi:MAG: DUF615 domain-containing protein [Desulfovibrionaceae bacterium]|nr:DUF615 domain-containing protein [Desulfovibrionaceae bacterium]